ncbi:glycosyltransferase [Gramella sp. Hel_I_59]|uniref:glycosyltransferase family 2 protein n=1 Tax=Gramella sp. Hel_I_59 TaxID=1249978 RepID=UPI00115440A0|nr:glycosyltransferase family 2 protein [Gramella sp. Hel_I_59]TQI71933.1 glycosyltransferase [Gramella sp. Hel_I_59]
MKVTIITATYNSADNIFTAMKSIATQSYLNIEWVVIDGGSSDKTLDIIKGNYSRELKIISEKDQGIYDALNKGIKLASGDIIGFVHSDDFLASPEIISEMVQTFRDRKVDGVYGDLEYVSKSDTSKRIRFWKSEQFFSKLLRKGWMPAHPTLFLRSEVYQKHGHFNLKYRIAADYDFILRVFSDSSLSFKYIPEVLTKMRVGGASNRSLKNIKLKSMEDLRALKTNKITNPYSVLLQKNLSKISQFF